MPRAYDRHQLVVDRNPLDGLSLDLARLPKLDPIDPAMLWQSFVDWIKELSGLDLSSPEKLVESIVHLLSDVAANIGGLIDGVLAALAAATGLTFTQGPVVFLQSLLDSLVEATQLDLSSPEALLASIIHLLENAIGGAIANVQDVLHTIGNVLGFPALPGFDLGELQAWVAQNVFGFINPNRLPIIPVSHIGDTTINLLSNPQFSDVAIHDPSSTWTVDTNVNHSGVAGSATTACSGALHELFSTDLIGVAVDQKLDLSAWVKMAGVVASKPGAVQLGVITFTTADGSGQGTVQNVATITNYSATSWQQMQGVYTATGDVKTLRVRIAVTGDATAGRVWFDDMWCAKQGKLPISLVQDLADELGNLWKGLQDGLAAAATALTEAVQGLLDKLAEFLHLDEWQVFLDNVWLALTGRPPQPDMVISPTDAADQLAILMATTAAQATTIAQLQAQVNQPVGGIVGGDDFERSDAANLGSGWEVINTASNAGYYFILNGQAVWQDQGVLVSNRVKAFRKGTPDAQTKTPWQAITRVTGTFIAESAFPINSARDFIYGRVSADRKAYIVAWTEAFTDLGDGGWQWRLFLGYNTGSGNDVVLRRKVVSPPAPGVTWTLQCGDLDGNADDQFSYRVLRNNAVVIEHTDTARVTAPMKDNKGWGFGGEALGLLVGQLTPSSLHSVTVMDIKAP